MKKLLFGIVLAAMFSCNKSEQFSKTQTAATSSFLRENRSVLQLETFDFPKEIEGCSCYFAKNKHDFENEEYIYADDFGKKAMIKIGGEMISFPIKEEDLSSGEIEKKSSNGNYEIHMKGKKINDLDETMMMEGEITVKGKDGKTVATPFYGECGC